MCNLSEEIKNEHKRQKELSSYKGDEYLRSFEGTKVTWVGTISDIDDAVIGDELYISVSLSNSLTGASAFVYNPKEEYLNLDKGTLVKVTGTINRINEFFGLFVYLDNVIIEKI